MAKGLVAKVIPPDKNPDRVQAMDERYERSAGRREHLHIHIDPRVLAVLERKTPRTRGPSGNVDEGGSSPLEPYALRLAGARGDKHALELRSVNARLETRTYAMALLILDPRRRARLGTLSHCPIWTTLGA
jgi:hypothetical protein